MDQFQEWWPEWLGSYEATTGKWVMIDTLIDTSIHEIL